MGVDADRTRQSTVCIDTSTLALHNACTGRSPLQQEPLADSHVTFPSNFKFPPRLMMMVTTSHNLSAGSLPTAIACTCPQTNNSNKQWCLSPGDNVEVPDEVPVREYKLEPNRSGLALEAPGLMPAIRIRNYIA